MNSENPSGKEPSNDLMSVGRYAWMVVLLLWPVATLNYLDRQMLSTMRISIKADIVELQSAEKFGQLMAIFMYVYALFSPLGGLVADRFNRKWLIMGSLAVWSAVTLLMGRAGSFSELYLLRALMGISEAFYIPAGFALIADYHRGPTRSLASGVHMSGIYTGQALGGIGGWIAQDVSWRAAFAGCGIIGVAYSFVIAACMRETTRIRPTARGGGASAGASASTFVWVGYVLLLLCFLFTSWPGWAVKNWLPTLLQDRFLLSQKASGLIATITNAGASFIGVILGGRLSDYWIGRHTGGRTWVSAAGLLLTIPAIIGIGLAPNLPLVILCTLLFGLGFGMFDVNNMPILCQLAQPRVRATGYGFMNFFGISAGGYLTPILGGLKDKGVPLAVGFAYCAIPTLIAVLMMLAIRPTSRDRGAEAQGDRAA